jgi:hypothetical protein
MLLQMLNKCKWWFTEEQQEEEVSLVMIYIF